MTLHEVYASAYLNKLAEFGITPDMLEKDAAISDAKKVLSYLSALNSNKGVGKTLNGVKSVLSGGTSAAKSVRDSKALSSFLSTLAPGRLEELIAQSKKARGIDISPFFNDLVRQTPKATEQLLGAKAVANSVPEAINTLKTVSTPAARQVGKINKHTIAVENAVNKAQNISPNARVKHGKNALNREVTKQQILASNPDVAAIQAKTKMPQVEQSLFKRVKDAPEQAHRIMEVKKPDGSTVLAPNSEMLHGDVAAKINAKSSRSNLWKYLLGGAGAAGAVGTGAYAATREPEPQGLSGLYSAASKRINSLFG